MTLTHTLLSLLAGAGTLATFGCSSVATDDGATSEDKLVTVPEGAEIESVSCGPAKAIDRLKLPPGLAAEDIENGTLAHNFVMKRVGTVDGQPYYAMDDSTYGLVTTKYTLKREPGRLVFDGGGDASFHQSRTILLTDHGAVAYQRRSGVSEYGGTAWEAIAVYGCSVQTASALPAPAPSAPPFNKVTCRKDGSIQRSALPSDVTPNPGTLAKSFTYEKAGAIDDKAYFSLTDATYGKLNARFFIKADDKLVSFSSADAVSEQPRDVIHLTGANSGVSYQIKSGISEYGDTPWEELARYKCTLE
ncbi:MAG: hypothetical protein U0235_21205 [Polyangiaceae bacterium]